MMLRRHRETREVGVTTAEDVTPGGEGTPVIPDQPEPAVGAVGVEGPNPQPDVDGQPVPQEGQEPGEGDIDPEEAHEDASPEKPAGNASLEAWREFALASGRTEADLEGLNRDGIRDLFAG